MGFVITVSGNVMSMENAATGESRTLRRPTFYLRDSDPNNYIEMYDGGVLVPRIFRLQDFESISPYDIGTLSEVYDALVIISLDMV